MRIRKRGALGAALVVVALAGCGSSGGSYDPKVAWSAGDQGTFDGACIANAPENYCHCALVALAAVDSNPKDLGGAFKAGMEAGQDESQFTACKGGGGVTQ